MKIISRCAFALIVSAALCTGTAPLAAQAVAPRTYQQVVSANPFGLLLELFNAEYERKVSESATAGFGGSFFTNSGDDYVNADVFFRFYPSGKPLEGWAFGTKVGITKVTDAGTYFGAGFDTNWSWLLGKNENFYVGVGFGLKRLFGTTDGNFDLEYIPTIRIVNVGFAF